MMDITHWLEKVQRRDLSAYYANLRHYLTAVGSANPSLHQATQRFGIPKSLDAYHDSVVMCHPWDGIGWPLPPMPEGDRTGAESSRGDQHRPEMGSGLYASP
jgi:hypothetical protein